MKLLEGLLREREYPVVQAEPRYALILKLITHGYHVAKSSP